MVEMIHRTTYRVQVLSPVHIGSGQTLGLHDIAVIDGRLWRFDVEKLAEHLARDLQTLDRYVTGGAAALAEWPETLRQACARYVQPWTGPPPREVREHIADALGRFYIPGTTLKGAIRTAILWAYHDGLSPEAKARQVDRIGQVRERNRAGEPWQRVVFGQDPNHDILRGLRVTDSSPVPLSRSAVAEVRVAVEEPSGQLTWFVRPGCHKENMAEALPLWVEVIPGNVEVTVTVEVDRFLTENATLTGRAASFNPAQELGFERKRRFLDTWVQRCNRMADRIARREQEWAARLGLDTYRKFYDWLLQDMEAHPDAVYLQLGWGVGWHGKTAVEPLGTDAVEKARRVYGLGRQGYPFPKTRRILFRQGRPYVPLGWVRLVPA